MYDILHKAKSRGTVYHQLLIGISVFDALSSLAYTLVGVMAPTDAGFFQSFGNTTTCQIQAFMIQLGLTSIFYNLALATYFYMVIGHNWKEGQFRKYLKYLHVVLALVGLALACAAIPYYGAQFGTCYLVSVSMFALVCAYTHPSHLCFLEARCPVCVAVVAHCNTLLWPTRHGRHCCHFRHDSLPLLSSLLRAKSFVALWCAQINGTQPSGVLAVGLLCRGLLRDSSVCAAFLLCQICRGWHRVLDLCCGIGHGTGPRSNERIDSFPEKGCVGRCIIRGSC